MTTTGSSSLIDGLGTGGPSRGLPKFPAGFLGGLLARNLDCPALRSRIRRINLVLLAVVLMGLADLAYTLTYMRGSGMVEANPIARKMIEIGSAQQLVLYKLLTLVICCGAIYFCRRTRQAELGAWICCLVMFGLTLHWVNYNSAVQDMADELAIMAELSRMPETASLAQHFIMLD
jgi:hypothetical protein